MEKLSLRKDVTLARTSDGRVVLADTSGLQSRPLAREELELLRHLDGSRSLADAQVAAAAAGYAISADAARQTAEDMQAAGFLEAPWAEKVAVRREQSGPVLRPAPPVFRAAPSVATTSGVVSRPSLRALPSDDERTELDPRAGSYDRGVAAPDATEMEPRSSRASLFPSSPPPAASPPAGPLPPLRRDLVVRERTRGTTRAYEVVDPVSRRVLALYPSELDLARELDGRRDLFGIIEVAQRRGIAVTPAKLWTFISMLQRSGFLEEPLEPALGRNEFSVMAPMPMAPDAPIDDAASVEVDDSLREDMRTLMRSPVPEPDATLDPPISSDPLSAQLASLQIAPGAHDPPPRSRRGILVAVAVAAALGGLGYFAIYPWARTKLLTTEVGLTEISLVSPVEASVELRSPGYVVPQTVSKVSAKVAGRVAEVLVKEGQVVRRGDRLVELDPSDARGTLATAKARALAASARVGAARAAALELESQVSRERTLVAQKVSPRSTLDDLEARLRSQRQIVRAAAADAAAERTEVENLEILMTELTVTAPIDGMVISKPAEVGELVGPEHDAILQLADLTTLLVETDVPEARLQLVRPGTPCEIVLDAFPDRRFRGVTAVIGQRVDRAKATVTVKVRFDEDFTGVMPDMAARVSFLTADAQVEAIQQPQRTVVPADAVIDRGGRKVVFVYDGSRARETPVRLGERLGSTFVLLEGPAAGTRVVSSPPAHLADGQAVTPRTH